MFLLEIDQVCNRIHISLSGVFDETQAERLLEQTRSRIEELHTDFHVLCDLSTLEEFTHSAKAHFGKLMELCNENKVRKIVRIIPDPLNNFGLNVMSVFHYDRSVPVLSFKTLNEALSHL